MSPELKHSVFDSPTTIRGRPNLSETLTPERRLWWVLAGITISVVLLFGVYDLLTLKAAPIWDATDYYAPFFSLVADHSKAFRLLMWDPWLDGGLPDFAEPQIGACSPLVLLFGLIFGNPFRGFIVYWIAEWMFGGLGMLLLCRHLKAPAWGSLLVSLGFLSCGLYTGHGEHTSITYSFSFLPWIIWKLDQALLSRDCRTAFQAGLLWGMSALGGYPQLVILDVLFFGLWTLGATYLRSDADFVFSRNVLKHRLASASLILVALGFIGALVLSPSYYGFLIETRGFTSRAHGIDRHWAMSNNLPPGAFSTLSSPYLYLLNLPPYRLWAETDVSMSNIYCGALTLVGAIFALTIRSRWRFWLAGVAAFFLCCSVGEHLPVRGWLYDFLPPTRYFRNPSLFAAYSLFVFFVLAAYGTRDARLMWTGAQRWVSIRLSIISVLASVLAGVWYYQTLRSAALAVRDVGFSSLHMAITWGVLVLLALTATTTSVKREVLVWGVLCLAVFDAGSTLYISRATLFSPAALPWWHEMMSRHNASLDLTSKGLDRKLHPPEYLGSYPNNRNIVIKEAVFFNDTALTNRYFEQFACNPALSHFVTGPKRIWFTDSSAMVPATDRSFQMFVEAAKRLNAPVLLLHDRRQLMQGTDEAVDDSWTAEVRGMVPASVDLLDYGTTTLSFRYHALSDGWLLVTDRWASGWSATVNWKRVEVLPADFIFRAVKVTKGDNTIVFRYRSRTYVALVVVSWITTLVCLVSIALGLGRRRNREEIQG